MSGVSEFKPSGTVPTYPRLCASASVIPVLAYSRYTCRPELPLDEGGMEKWCWPYWTPYFAIAFICIGVLVPFNASVFVRNWCTEGPSPISTAHSFYTVLLLHTKPVSLTTEFDVLFVKAFLKLKKLDLGPKRRRNLQV